MGAVGGEEDGGERGGVGGGADGDRVEPRVEDGLEGGADLRRRGELLGDGAEDGAFGGGEGIGRVEQRGGAGGQALGGAGGLLEELHARLAGGEVGAEGGARGLRLGERGARRGEAALLGEGGVGGRLGHALERLDLAGDVVEARGQVADRGLEAGLLGGEALVAEDRLAVGGLGLAELVLEAGAGALELDRLLAKALERGAGLVGVAVQRIERGASGGEPLLGGGGGLVEPREARVDLAAELRLVVADGARAGDLLLVALLPGAVLGEAKVVVAQLLVGVRAGVVGGGGGLDRLGDALLRLGDDAAQRLERGLRLLDAAAQPAALLLRLLERGGEGAAALVELREADAGQIQVDLAQLGLQLLVAAGARGLGAERMDLAAQLRDDVGEAGEVLVGRLELAQRLAAVGAEAGDAGRLLEDRAAVLGAGGEDGVDLPLGHHGVGRRADARVHEEALDVAEAAGRAVDEVLALAGAEDAAGDGDLVELEAELLLAVGDEGLVVVGAGEDDVGHRAAAQGGGPLLAEDPADGVRDVGLAAAVGADDGGDAGLEDESRLLREALEAVDFECLEIHGRGKVKVERESGRR